ncbi:phosphoglycerate mutase [archaeon]|nr:phosphoglycerate mutase [archaeon]|tara:strand:+ start:581 stop:1789 length:1209 start_codon:yes stop_codon:yes gene_type:complete
MKKILIILDGLGDLPCKELKGKTPLEAAKTPNLDFLAKNGKTGLMVPSNEKIPESEVALNILGYTQKINRGILEALGSKIKISPGDLCLRTNFATKKDNKIIDRRAGRSLTTKEAKSLANDLSKRIKLAFPFIFQATVQHRGVLVIKGGFSDNITDADPEHSKTISSQPLDEDETTKLSANLVNNFLEQADKILKDHPVNKFREDKKLLPANTITTRGAGTEIPKLEEKKDWTAILSMPTEIGIAKLIKMRIVRIKQPKVTENDIYKNLYTSLNTHIKVAKKYILKKVKFSKLRKYVQQPNFYIHFKETDIPGHDGLPLEKKKMIELLDDTIFKELTKLKDTLICITGDHSTPCKLKSHSDDPVPVLIYGKNKDSIQDFSEKACKKGKIGLIKGKDLMKHLY